MLSSSTKMPKGFWHRLKEHVLLANIKKEMNIPCIIPNNSSLAEAPVNKIFLCPSCESVIFVS